MKIDPGFSIILATVAGFIGKIIWDWFKSGHLEKGVYVKTVDCEKNREKCCLPQLKRDSGILESRLTAAEKRLDQGREDFRLLREDISEMKESLAGIKAVLEAFLKEKG
jgi:hypothetical protein